MLLPPPPTPSFTFHTLTHTLRHVIETLSSFCVGLWSFDKSITRHWIEKQVHPIYAMWKWLRRVGSSTHQLETKYIHNCSLMVNVPREEPTWLLWKWQRSVGASHRTTSKRNVTPAAAEPKQKKQHTRYRWKEREWKKKWICFCYCLYSFLG